MENKFIHKEYLPYGRQWIDEDDIQAVVEVLRSDFLTTGPKVGEFEKAFAAKVGAKYAVAVSNGTAALHAAAFTAGIGAGDEVITTPLTFAASANCILYQGGKPVFADIDSKTYNIDCQGIRKKITEKTKAIIPVHFTGQPVDLDEIHAIAKEHNLVVIEDAAHALGAEYKGKKIGGLSDLTIFSFHPVKHITTGEGGMVTTNNPEYYRKLLLFRSHGITRDQSLLKRNEGRWYYEQQLLGYNYRMTDIQAALGISQLRKLEKFVRRREEIVRQYNQAFKELPGLTLPYQMENTRSSWHLYTIQVNPEEAHLNRDKLFADLMERNIGVNVHYIPVYWHPHYRNLGYPEGLCPEAEAFYARAISLPLFSKMTDQDVAYLIDTISGLIRK